ncbi:unnamed protein product, partial [Prorocentrum cordatum]
AVVLALRIPRTKNNISGTLPALNLMDQVFAMKLGEGTRDVLQLYQKARRAISDCDDLILPELIVAAQQSAGKSMLLTQLLGGGVTFPSATGTCTKCPTVVYSKWSAGPQKCTFKKRFFFDDVSKTELNEVQVHPGPASDSELKGTQEVTAETWNLIPNEIAKLQKEILKGPGKDLKLEFSHNEIIVEVEGSEFPDLIIKDLPGLVAGMDKRLCEALQSITERSMEKTNAIILACITCETHSDNQGILELARKFDKEGRRTIGVLTKPDRIEATTEKPWIELLNNAHKPLKYGWYVVRCPDQKQYRDQISNSMARENETRFFDEEDVGKKMKSAQPDRCGINKLLACASSIVADLVRVQVPVLRTRICQNIETYKAEYDRLFESCGVAVPEDRIRDHLLKVIGDVCRPMEDVLRRSDRTSSVLWQSVREKLRIARKKLEKTVPTSKPPPQANGQADPDPPSKTCWALDDVLEMLRGGKSVLYFERNGVNFAAQQIIHASLKECHLPVIDCILEIQELLDDFCKRMMPKSINRRLASKMLQGMKQLVAQNKDACWKQMQTVLDLFGCYGGGHYPVILRISSLGSGRRRGPSPRSRCLHWRLTCRMGSGTSRRLSLHRPCGIQ